MPSHSISAVLPAGSTVPSPPVKTISRPLYLLDEADSAAPDWSVSTPSQVAGADDPLAARFSMVTSPAVAFQSDGAITVLGPVMAPEMSPADKKFSPGP